jgi:hypothetical protein
MRVLAFMICLWAFEGMAQKKTLPELVAQYGIPNRDGEIMYELIDSSVIGKSKDEVFRASQATLVEAFKDSKDVLEVIDKEDGHLMGKGNTTYYFNAGLYRANIRLPFVIDIRAKDGRYRIQLRDLNTYTYWNEVNGKITTEERDFSSLPSKGKGYQEDFLSLMDKRLKAIIVGLQDGINKKLKNSDSF